MRDSIIIRQNSKSKFLKIERVRVGDALYGSDVAVRARQGEMEPKREWTAEEDKQIEEGRAKRRTWKEMADELGEARRVARRMLSK